MHFQRHFLFRLAPTGAFIALVAGLVLHAPRICAHGFAGQRFFPATLTTDDPFVADELSLPTLSTIRTPDNGGTRELDVSIDISKRITPYLDIEIGQGEVNLFPRQGANKTGLSNLELGSKFQFYTNEPHEFILSAGIDVTVGGTGSRQVGRDAFTTWSPGLFFGKGFGDLPEGLPWLRPVALTGNLSVDLPSSASTRTFGGVDPVTGRRDVGVDHNPVSLETDFALEYSLIYLQEHVRNIGLGKPFDRLIPLVEFVLDTPLNRGRGGLTTGTVNPGVICQAGSVNLASRRSFRSTSAAATMSACSGRFISIWTICFRKPSAGRCSAAMEVTRSPAVPRPSPNEHNAPFSSSSSSDGSDRDHLSCRRRASASTRVHRPGGTGSWRCD